MNSELAALGVAFASAVLLTGAARGYAFRAAILDIPNERSMHKRPTPRGGGIAIVITFLAASIWMAIRGEMPRELALALIPGGVVVAAIGWFDDRHTLSNRVRMSLWVPTAGWAVYWLGGLPRLDLGAFVIPLGLAGAVIAVIGVVWLLNLYNFMDGTDGLAGSQAVMAGAAAGALLLLGSQSHVAIVPLMLAATAAGFLAWNWPPAKIFMGDVGSGFLGFTFAVLAIHSENTGALPLAIWAILLAVFLIDATLTVARRIKRREKWGEAHRSHAYQVQARKHSHRAVLLAFLGIESVLAAAAYVTWQWPMTLLPMLAIVVVGLGVGWKFASKDVAATKNS